MYLRHLRNFVAVVEQESFARAAEELRVALPLIYLSVRNIESAFGTPLLKTLPDRKVIATDAGILFFNEAQATIERLDRLRTDIKTSAK